MAKFIEVPVSAASVIIIDLDMVTAVEPKMEQAQNEGDTEAKVYLVGGNVINLRGVGTQGFLSALRSYRNIDSIPSSPS